LDAGKGLEVQGKHVAIKLGAGKLRRYSDEQAPQPMAKGP